VINPGSTAVARSVLQFFLSTDETLDEGDSLLKEVKIGPLAAGETEEVDLHVKLPKGQNASGQFVIAVLDATNVVPEANEENNIVVSPPVQ
jgi:trimeric autotransporter adhesin